MRISEKEVLVTPEMAKNWLKRNEVNRHLRREVVDLYAADMRSGNWVRTHQGIAFYADGNLADGQHRLHAIVKTNVSVIMRVTNGLERKAALAIDKGSSRQIHDGLVLSGEAPWVNRNIVAIIRYLQSNFGANTKPKSIRTIADYANRHKELLITVDRIYLSKKQYLTTSLLFACYACALHAGVSPEVIKRFAHVMYSGEPEGSHENAAVRLREYIMLNPSALIGSGRPGTARRAMRAIQAFNDRKPLSKLMEPTGNIYPVPE